MTPREFDTSDQLSGQVRSHGTSDGAGAEDQGSALEAAYKFALEYRRPSLVAEAQTAWRRLVAGVAA